MECIAAMEWPAKLLFVIQYVVCVAVGVVLVNHILTMMKPEKPE